MKAILLDIEGTTTPIDFVHKTLFPFAKARTGEFVRQNFDKIKPEIEQLEIEYRADFTNQIYGRDFRADSAESVVNYLKFLIDVDRKSTPLKSLQGEIWRAGYESGELESEIFPDVPRAFERWKEQGKRIAIFSSGSVLAQKLIFKYSNFGDLSGFIVDYFDTANGGAKKEAESYRRIAEKLDFEAGEVLFVSDVLAELDAARDAGMQTALCIRAGNGQITEDFTHRSLNSFDELES
ncbi:MAG TPA: acireductone synthase [Pyrinomonadaceae bacterium]|jgi:enolase-phosphatase E1